jgi:excisionase family DNA binding protein
MTGLPLAGLLSVEDVAGYLSLSTKTVRRMISRGELVTRRLGRSVRVDASSVTSLLAGSATSTVVETIAMKKDNKKGEYELDVPRLLRQRGRSKVWTALISGQEVPLGTTNEKEAKAKLIGMRADLGGSTGPARKPWRVHYSKTRGFAVMYYDEDGVRRLHRVPSTEEVADQRAAEAYAERWYRDAVRRMGQAPPMSRAGAAPTVTAALTFEQFARLWTKGDLAKRYPDHVKTKRTAKGDEQRLRLYVYPVIGTEPMSAFEGRRGLELVEKVQAALPPVAPTFTRGSRRQVLQAIHRVLVLAAYPAKLISASPLPKGFLPKVESNKAKTYLYPDEDAKLMACAAVPVATRLCYGILIREGFRVSELLSLTWSDVDLERGVVVLESNKTDEPRSWVLDPGVVEALRRWKADFAWRPGPSAPILRTREDGRVDRFDLAEGLRRSLAKAGITRSQIFERTDTRLPLRAHDLRASFVTINLAIGKNEAWITDRTGHRSSQMIYRYKRQARTHAELNLGGFTPLHQAIPELAGSTP